MKKSTAAIVSCVVLGALLLIGCGGRSRAPKASDIKATYEQIRTGMTETEVREIMRMFPGDGRQFYVVDDKEGKETRVTVTYDENGKVVDKKINVRDTRPVAPPREGARPAAGQEPEREE